MIYIRYSSATNLGNWLFQYAVARSADEAVALYVPTPVRPGRFDALMHIVPSLKIVTQIPEGIAVCGDSEAKAGLPKDRPLLLDGYFQKTALFDEAVVRVCLACPRDVSETLERKYGARLAGRTSVGISVRRGDYLKLPHRHPFVGTTYLRDAVQRFSADALYVVCSDDIPWCKAFFSAKRFPGREFLFVEHEGVLEQLYIHARCTHNIISNSTFSWWGAWLNPNPGKRVVFPARWIGPAVHGDASPLYFPGSEIVRSPYMVGVFLGMVGHMVRLKAGNLLRALKLR